MAGYESTNVILRLADSRVELNVGRSTTGLQLTPRGGKILYREFMSDTDDIFVWNRSPSRKWKIPNEIYAATGALLIRFAYLRSEFMRTAITRREDSLEKFSYYDPGGCFELNDTVSIAPACPVGTLSACFVHEHTCRLFECSKWTYLRALVRSTVATCGVEMAFAGTVAYLAKFSTIVSYGNSIVKKNK